MRDGKSSGYDGAGDAVGLEPDRVAGDGDVRSYADNQLTSRVKEEKNWPHEDLETIDAGWLLLRTLVNQPAARREAESLGLRGYHFVDIGFDYAISDLLKPLYAEPQWDFDRLRHEFPGFFDVIDHGGPVATDYYLRTLVLWFIDEANYLNDAGHFGFSQRVAAFDRNRRHDIEACLRYDMKGFAASLLPSGDVWDSGQTHLGRVTSSYWQAHHAVLGSVGIRVNYGRVGRWHCDGYAARSPILLAQVILESDLRSALDFAEDYLNRADDLTSIPLPSTTRHYAPEKPPLPAEQLPPEPENMESLEQLPPTISIGSHGEQQRPASPPAPLCPVDVDERLPAGPSEPPAEPRDIVVQLPPPPAAPPISEEQASLRLDSAAAADIDAQNLTAAVELVKAGFAIFRAHVYWKDGRWKKKPIGAGWQIGTTDPERVRLLWRQHPKAVPGIALGRAGLVAIDADRHGGPDGVSAFDKLIAEHEGLPGGPITATAGGGFHYIFKQPDGKPLGNHDGVLHGQGINVRGRGGWIVGPGAVCPDGSMWRTADGSPSLIEAFRNGTIPTIPAWFVDIVRPPKPARRKKAPNAEQTETAEPPSSARPPQSRKAVTKREKAYARGAFEKIVEELAAMSPNSGRNAMTYRKAFALGTMIARGWIDAETVKTELFSACELNGLVAEGDDVLGAIKRGINDGSAHPHEDLADRRTRGARQPRDSTKAWVNLLAIEIYRLHRVRPGGEYASVEAARDVIAAVEREGHVIENLSRNELGELVGVTFAEHKAIGEMFGRHPSRFLPYDATQDEVDAHLAAIDKAKKPARAQAARERRAREKLEREQPPPNEPMARRCAAIVAYARRRPGKHRTGDLVHGLERAKAFDGLTDQSRRNAIVELLRLAVAGKLPELTKFVIVTEEIAKNRKPTFTIEYQE